MQRFVALAGSAAQEQRARADVEIAPIRESGDVPASYGESESRASAPREEHFVSSAARYRLRLLDVDRRARRRELEIDWAGDVARVLVDGEVVADRFWDGGPWLLDLDELGSGDLVLEILPMSPDARIGLAETAERRRRSESSALLSLDSVVVTHWYRWVAA